LFPVGSLAEPRCNNPAEAGGRSPRDLYKDLPRNEADVFFLTEGREMNKSRGANPTTIPTGCRWAEEKRVPLDGIGPASARVRGTSGDHPRRPPSKKKVVKIEQVQAQVSLTRGNG
jgi:hypothetical protein